MNGFYERCMGSPLGEIRLFASDEGLVGVYLTGHKRLPSLVAGDGRASPLLDEAERQLEAYFGRRLRVFDLPLDMRGSAFQREVWRALVAIPFGATRSYGDLARALGRPSAARAVGAANARNLIGIVVPCHRVIGGSGALTGYAGGIEAKRWLLAHEC